MNDETLAPAEDAVSEAVADTATETQPVEAGEEIPTAPGNEPEAQDDLDDFPDED